jgi:protein disulfide-isomerase
VLTWLSSPWCHHCQAYAPTYQTLYEFYYTSTPAGSADENPDFTKFYDFRFASLDCIKYGDLCAKHGVTAYPQTVLYQDGKIYGEAIKGVKDIPAVSKVIEEALEMARPGTRPKSLELPKPGDKESPAYKETHTLKKDGKAADPSQNAKAAATTKAAAVPHKAVTKKPKKPTAKPNPEGKSVVLNADSFQTRVTMTQDPWFIKFYAPWCHHCQAMAPNWEQLAKEMKGRLNIGEVNCDANARLCKDAKLRGYPTILFFKGGERVEYDGLRGLGDFVQYAEKAIDIASGVEDVDAASFKELEEKEEVMFVYFYDHATTSEDFLALERLPMSLIGRAKLVKTQDEELYKRFKITTWPRLLVAREGRPTYYAPLTPREMRETHQVLRWMRSVWLPIVPELTASNAREIMDGKLVVLGILNREDKDRFFQSKREMKSAANEWMDKQIQLFQLERQELRDAKQLRIEEAEDRNDQRALRAAKAIRINMDKSDHKEVVFAWCDGVFWQRWVRTTYGIDVKDGERVIINDEDVSNLALLADMVPFANTRQNRRYWDQTITGNYIIPSRTSILETLNKITASPPKIKPKLTISSFEKIFFDIRMTFSEHPFLSVGCVLGIALGCASWFRGRLRRTRGGHFRLPEDLPTMKDFKAPLLGSNTNGKVD